MTPEEAHKAAIEHAQIMLERAKAAQAEDAKWSATRKVWVAAKPRGTQNPNASKFKHYWIEGLTPKTPTVLDIGGKAVEVELTERQIHNLKLDSCVTVSDTAPEVAPEAKTAEAIPPAPPEPPFNEAVPAAAKAGLQDLQATKKGKR